jgi:hypothetical protein
MCYKSKCGTGVLEAGCKAVIGSPYRDGDLSSGFNSPTMNQ